MQKIKRFKLKDGITIEDIRESYPHLNDGGSWIHDDSKTMIFKPSLADADDISVNIGFPEDFSQWNDFDYVLVLDEAFCQPYTPFYDFMDGRIKTFPFLYNVVKSYNEFMSSLNFLEEVEE